MAKRVQNLAVTRPSQPDIQAAAKQFAGQSPEKTERISIDAPAGLRKVLRRLAVEHDSTIKGLVLEALAIKYSEVADMLGK